MKTNWLLAAVAGLLLSNAQAQDSSWQKMTAEEFHKHGFSKNQIQIVHPGDMIDDTAVYHSKIIRALPATDRHGKVSYSYWIYTKSPAAYAPANEEPGDLQGAFAEAKKKAEAMKAARDIASKAVPKRQTALPADYWMSIQGVVDPARLFTMGTDDPDPNFNNAKPPHYVTVKGFEMAKAETTVGEYRQCVDAGVCTVPRRKGSTCNWSDQPAGRELHPVNCVNWHQADAYAKFVGARLPTEAEWEYAAKNRGGHQKYPWGDKDPNCDTAVMSDCPDQPFILESKPVCSKSAGNTAQGLCDMAGNVWEWVQDWYHESYELKTGEKAPKDGRAWENPQGSRRVLRGGSFSNGSNSLFLLRADYRRSDLPNYSDSYIGFRLARGGGSGPR